MTPESRISIESEWSQWMLIGPERARLPSATTIGARIDAAMYTTSAIRASPCDDVAVIVRAPARAAPIAALIAECSDSTLTISVCALPVGDELREGLDDRRLRRDRVDRNHVGVDLAHRVRDRLAAGEELDVVRAGSAHSDTIAIAPTGQTSAQIAQPLQ